VEVNKRGIEMAGIEWTEETFLEYLVGFLGAFPEDLDQAADYFNEFAETAKALLLKRQHEAEPIDD